uniref:Uncharacterized protein n=1 Tax=Anguilla anguilla TaxID=7936 RepID=A0A0E9X934_ANGAN
MCSFFSLYFTPYPPFWIVWPLENLSEGMMDGTEVDVPSLCSLNLLKPSFFGNATVCFSGYARNLPLQVVHETNCERRGEKVNLILLR